MLADFGFPSLARSLLLHTLIPKQPIIRQLLLCPVLTLDGNGLVDS